MAETTNTEFEYLRECKKDFKNPAYIKKCQDHAQNFIPNYLSALRARDIDLTSGKVLSVGCGSGFHEMEMRKDNIDITGLDYSCDMVSVGNKICQSINFPYIFKVGDITQKIAISDNHYDFVLCNMILHHIKKLNFPFSELYRILKPSGKIIIYELNCYNPFRLLSAFLIAISIKLPRLFWLAPHNKEGFHSNWKLRKYLREANFIKISEKSFYFQESIIGITKKIYFANNKFWSLLHLPAIGAIDTLIVGQKPSVKYPG